MASIKLCVSSYGRDKEHSLSLYTINVDKKSYQISDSLALTEPSFCISYHDIIFTYSKEPLELYMIKVINNKLEIIDRLSLPFETLTHLYYDEIHHSLYGASYKNGKLVKVNIINQRFGEHTIKDIGGTCHCIIKNETKGFLYEANLVKDEIHQFDRDLNLLDTYTFPKGSGPRHLLIEDNNMYVVTELSNELYKIKLDDHSYIKTSTLTPNFKGVSYGATILSDDKYLYVSNRGEESINVFDKDLMFIKSLSCYGEHPRHMIWDDNKDYIISFNKDSNNISFINKDNELLFEIPYSKVSCGCIIK